MDKMRMESADLLAKNVEKLGSLFPECITEIENESGEVVHGVDFSKLRQLLDGSVSEDAERYDFTWVGKRAALAEAYKPIRKTLRPCPEESVDWDNTQNLYIEGDNLDVLKLLQESYLGKVDVIYIDPPYNTGSDSFVYPDNYRSDDDEYDEKAQLLDEEGKRVFKENGDTRPRFHSDWCSMIYSRLLVAKSLLADDGVVFISIDERENFNLRHICNEIFGEKNYIGDLVWEATTQPINAGSAKFGLQKKTEPILFYAKNKLAISGFELEEIENDLHYPHVGKLGKCRFEIIEKSDTGGYSRPTMKYEILGRLPREGKRWQIGEETARMLEKAGKIEIVDGIVKKAVYPEDEIDKKHYKPFWSLLLAEEVGSALKGKDEVNCLMGKSIGFDTVKPTDLIKRLLSYFKKDCLVVDFFSGTATTADAVFQLNSKDGGTRNFIMVQFPEECKRNSDAYKAGFSTICEIGKERLRQAGKQVKEGASFKGVDIGFRVFKVDESNMKPIFYGVEDMSQSLLEATLSNIKEDRTGLDLLFGCLLDWGLPLSLPYKEETIEGAKFLNYADGALMACFDDTLNESVMKAAAKRRPTRVVFRDSCFKDSATKINLAEIFKLYSPETTIKTL